MIGFPTLLSSLFRLPALVSVLLMSMLSVSLANAQDSCTSTGWPADAELTVTQDSVDGIAGHRLTWPLYCGFSKAANYDIYYNNPNPGNNESTGRIEAGAGTFTGLNTGTYFDPSPARDPGKYLVQAMDKRGKRGVYSEPDLVCSDCSGGSTTGGSTTGGTDGGSSSSVGEIQVVDSALDNDSYLTCDAANVARAAAGLIADDGRPGYVPDELGFQHEFTYTFEDTTLNDLAAEFDSIQRWGKIVTNNEQQYYVDALGGDSGYAWSPFKFIANADNSYLVIEGAPSASEAVNLEAHQVTGTDSNNNPLANPQEFVSGILTSKSDFTHGYFEMRAKMPLGKGTWPAFWLYNSRLESPGPEIDIFEYLGQSRDSDGNWVEPGWVYSPLVFDHQWHTYHWATGRGRRKNAESFQNYTTYEADQEKMYSRQEAKDKTAALNGSGYYAAIEEWCTGGDVDFSANFHVYGVKWKPEEIVWFIDGIEVMRIVEDATGQNPDTYDAVAPVYDGAMYLILDFSIGGNWPSDPDETTYRHFDVNNVNEVNFAIDYVKAFNWSP